MTLYGERTFYANVRGVDSSEIVGLIKGEWSRGGYSEKDVGSNRNEGPGSGWGSTNINIDINNLDEQIIHVIFVLLVTICMITNATQIVKKEQQKHRMEKIVLNVQMIVKLALYQLIIVKVVTMICSFLIINTTMIVINLMIKQMMPFMEKIWKIEYVKNAWMKIASVEALIFQNVNNVRINLK